MFFRLLLLFLIVWFLIWLIKKQFSTPSSDEPQDQEVLGEDMIACDYCGAHAPKSLVVRSGEKNYCCQKHAELDE